MRTGPPELHQCPFALLLTQVAQAPAVRGLKHLHMLPERHQLTDDPAQEVRVAMIPIGNQRVIEKNEPHILPLRPGFAFSNRRCAPQASLDTAPCSDAPGG